jgi:hypothetical protein
MKQKIKVLDKDFTRSLWNMLLQKSSERAQAEHGHEGKNLSYGKQLRTQCAATETHLYSYERSMPRLALLC